MEKIEETFFMLYVDGQNSPTHKHTSIAEAKVEAQRLMAKTQKRVFILQGIKMLEPKMDFFEVDLAQNNGA